MKKLFNVWIILVMWRKITLLQSASICWAIIGPNTKKKHRWYVVVVPTSGQQQYNCWNFSVGPMLVQCQHANNNVLPTTPTITQRLPYDCLLSGFCLCYEDLTLLTQKDVGLSHLSYVLKTIYFSSFKRY